MNNGFKDQNKIGYQIKRIQLEFKKKGLKMKKVISSIFTASAIFVFGNIFLATGVQIEGPATCSKCGMDRTSFSSSRAIITFEDGTKVGTCSIGCAQEVASDSSGRKISVILVADYYSKVLINAKNAVWVIGGDKAAVMSSVPTWAFSDSAGARKFIKESGGKIGGFYDLWITDSKKCGKGCCNNHQTSDKCFQMKHTGDTTSIIRKCTMINNNAGGMFHCPMMNNAQSSKDSSSSSYMKKVENTKNR
jgi:nitrous oxide reductase accessory protein NosL